MPINSRYLHFDYRGMTNELLVGGRAIAPPHPRLLRQAFLFPVVRKPFVPRDPAPAIPARNAET